MQLVELISKTAQKEGVQPKNLSSDSLIRAFSQLEGDPNVALGRVDPARAVARASILRVANQVIGHALPYFNISLPEELWRLHCTGVLTDIEVLPSISSGPTQQLHSGKGAIATGFNAATPRFIPQVEETKTAAPLSWNPPCFARRLRSFRRLLFNHTKTQFWDEVLEATTTPTPLHQDEYEDPREIHNIGINRVKATATRLAAIPQVHDRVKQSVFGQLKDSLKKWGDTSFRRSYLGKGHGGQRRAFKVKFHGEGVNDYGGPYRAVFEQVYFFC
jgi:hypothetical protein